MAFGNLWGVLGKNPSTEDKREFQASSNYDVERSTFVNTDQAFVDKMFQQSMNVKNMAQQIREFARTKNLAPETKIPEVAPDFSGFTAANKKLKVVWFGHSSFLLNLEGVNILVDPVFGNASPVSFAGKRFQQPVTTPEQLPEIDVVVISHDHYDHLEMDSMKFYANSQAQFLVPLGVGSHLRHWGVKADRIIERDGRRRVRARELHAQA